MRFSVEVTAGSLVPPQRRKRMTCSCLRPSCVVIRTIVLGLALLTETIVSKLRYLDVAR